MRILNLVLGAGFSATAEQPLARDLTKMFNDDYKGRLFRRPSSEWHWRKTKEGDIQTPNPDGETLEYLFNEIVKDYHCENRSNENYEDLFDFIESKDNDWIKNLGSRAAQVYIAGQAKPIDPKTWVLTKLKDTSTTSTVVDIFGWLIADALRCKYSKMELREKYKPFINHISKYEKVNIHTLNHDLIIETIVDQQELSDGFSSEKSSIANPDAEYELFPVFANTFDKRVNLYKLHGSIDLLRYKEISDEGGRLNYTGKYTYFKTQDDYAKHMPVRLDPKTKTILQNIPIDIEPQFITGRNKPNKINNDYMYRELFKNFSNNMSKASEVLIIGYGYGDVHVNDIIKSIPKDSKIININPGRTFDNDGFQNMKNFKSISEALSI